VAEGYRYLTRHHEVLEPFWLLLAGQGLLSVVIVNVPAVATVLVRIPASAAGAAIVAPFAAGALIGAIQAPRLLAGGTRRRRLIESSLLVLGMSLAGLITVVPALSGWLRIAFGATFSAIFGSAIIGLLVPARSALLEGAPGGYQGRIFGSLSVLVNLVSIGPVVFSGTVGHLTGVRVPLGVLGLACLSGLALFRRTARAFPVAGVDPVMGPLQAKRAATDVPSRVSLLPKNGSLRGGAYSASGPIDLGNASADLPFENQRRSR
jgi:MFS family permease